VGSTSRSSWSKPCRTTRSSMRRRQSSAASLLLRWQTPAIDLHARIPRRPDRYRGILLRGEDALRDDQETAANDLAASAEAARSEADALGSALVLHQNQAVAGDANHVATRDRRETLHEPDRVVYRIHDTQ